jgi:hypothetical protein
LVQVGEEVPGAKAQIWEGFIAWAKAQAYLRCNDKDKDKGRSRFPEGMTERKATAKAKTAAYSKQIPAG